jgi:hypothetical protein
MYVSLRTRQMVAGTVGADGRMGGWADWAEFPKAELSDKES